MPTPKHNLPLYGDTDTAALDTLLNGQSNAVELALNNIQKQYAQPVANAAARTALFPSPVQGNAVYRQDLGYEERYYGAYNATSNPGGAATAGWYAEGAGIPMPGITLGSLYTNHSAWQALTLTRTGKRARLYGVATNTQVVTFGTQTAYTLGTIPAGLRPVAAKKMLMPATTSANPSASAWVGVYNDGRIDFCVHANQSSQPTGAWLLGFDIEWDLP